MDQFNECKQLFLHGEGSPFAHGIALEAAASGLLVAHSLPWMTGDKVRPMGWELKNRGWWSSGWGCWPGSWEGEILKVLLSGVGLLTNTRVGHTLNRASCFPHRLSVVEYIGWHIQGNGIYRWNRITSDVSWYFTRLPRRIYLIYELRDLFIPWIWVFLSMCMSICEPQEPFPWRV